MTHLLVAGPGPYYAPLTDLDFDEAHRDVDAHLWLPLHIAREARTKVRHGEHFSSLPARTPAAPLSAPRSSLRSARRFPTLANNVALELAPIRVNAIAAGLVDTPLSAAILGDRIDQRRRSSGKHCPSVASSARPTSPPSPSTS